jgi:thioredoxin-like negative regulator of GroEL
MSVVTADGSWQWARPELMQRAAHLAALRILLEQRRIELGRVAEAADALTCMGYELDREDAQGRIEFGRRMRQLSREIAAAEYEVRAAERALRVAILDDAWTPSDDVDGPRSSV